ncbi:MAG: GNAT family N-acetyltransferase [Gemmatimonadota bacterium]|nr:GNAT family N-acetyltransferase [Gemmatimonadota bacterium]
MSDLPFAVPGSPSVIVPASSPVDLADIRLLFIEYAAWLGDHLDRERFAIELAALPGYYAPPTGGLFLARLGDEAVGCVGIRPLMGDNCELKRLYTRVPYRGCGVGRQLLEAAVAAARTAGYAAIRLDTLASMKEAQALYQRLGFRDIPAYWEDPISDMRYLELRL